MSQQHLQSQQQPTQQQQPQGTKLYQNTTHYRGQAQQYTSYRAYTPPRPKAIVLRFSPYAWAKLLFMRDIGGTEVGAKAITRKDDFLYVEDMLFIKQRCSAVLTRFSDSACNQLVLQMHEKGIPQAQFDRVWVHTHPGNSATPSGTDEENLINTYGNADWMIMFILAKGGETYCRLRMKPQLPGGPIVSMNIPHEIDWTNEFQAADHAAWELEYHTNIFSQWDKGWTDDDEDGDGFTDEVKPKPIHGFASNSYGYNHYSGSSHQGQSSEPFHYVHTGEKSTAPRQYDPQANQRYAAEQWRGQMIGRQSSGASIIDPYGDTGSAYDDVYDGVGWADERVGFTDARPTWSSDETGFIDSQPAKVQAQTSKTNVRQVPRKKKVSVRDFRETEEYDEIQEFLEAIRDDELDLLYDTIEEADRFGNIAAAESEPYTDEVKVLGSSEVQHELIPVDDLGRPSGSSYKVM
jgi:hypothetical protein